MNDSLIVWTAVAVLALVAVILYCLWRLLARRSARPVPGRASDAEVAESVRVGHSPSEATVNELGGPELEAARGRARSAAVQRAEQREAAAVNAAAPASASGLGVAEAGGSDWAAGSDGAAVSDGADYVSGVGIGIGAGTDTDAGVSIAAVSAVDAGSGVGGANGIDHLQYSDDIYEDDGRR